MRNQIIFGIIVLAAIIVAGYFYNKYHVAPKIKFGNLQLVDLDGAAINLQHFKGRPVFINFFATWCGPCLAELPLLQQVQQKMAGDNAVFIYISDESASTLKAFGQRKGPMLIYKSQLPLQQLHIFSVPTSYLLNGNGEIVYKTNGEITGTAEDITQEFRKALQ